DFRYLYIAGGLFDGPEPCASCASGCVAGGKSCSIKSNCRWWGCWQYAGDPPGAYVRNFLDEAKGRSQIPTITYYQYLQTSGLSEGVTQIRAGQDVGFLTRYLNDWRFLLKQVGQTQALLHIEPDLWAYAQQVNENAHHIPAAVAQANPSDCSGQERSFAGLGRCMIAMVRKYAPNVKVGLHASRWSTRTAVSGNTDPSLDVGAEARKTGAFLSESGLGDFLVVDFSDRDAGYYESIGQNVWLDPTNRHLPNFHQMFVWAKVLAETVQRPLLWWQIPLGNMRLPNVKTQWRDNRVDYLFAHLDEVVTAHGFGLAFGPGEEGQTSPETDNGNLIAKAKAYAARGGQRACP